jgi:outer membrane protein TolC
MELLNMLAINPNKSNTHYQKSFNNRANGLMIASFMIMMSAQSQLAYAQDFENNSQNILSLTQAERVSLQNEPGLISQKWQSQSLSEQAIADGQLKDPKLQLNLANLPTDSFNFDQENMTQFKMGITQQFPAGKTLDLKQQKKQKQSQLVLTKMAERKLVILQEVRLSYLEIYYWEQAKKTISKNKKLFSQLVEIVQSLFSVGRNNQQDLIRAQLELSRLDDRLVKITQKINTQRSKLSRWIGAKNSYLPLDKNLPTIELPQQLQQLTLDNQADESFAQLSQLFHKHPKILEIDKKIEVSRKDIEIATESYKPGWGVNVSYGYRDNNPNGQSRSDFVSAGVTFDLPLFTANRQDKKRLAKEYAYQALKDKRNEVLHQVVSKLQQEITIEEQLTKRHQLYNSLLLPQAKQQTTASLVAYQSDRGDFADVMRAYIDNLNVNLDERRIAVDHLQSRANMLYFMPRQSTLQN